MDFEGNPNDRRRVDPEAQRNRDAEVARLRRAGVPFRTIAERLGMSLGAVQKAVRRYQKLADAFATGQAGDVLWALSAEDVTVVADIGRLDALEYHRLNYFEPDSPQRVALAGWLASHSPVSANSGTARGRATELG